MKILIVEDEPKLARFIEKGLSEEGYETIIAYDGEIGRRLALNQPFNLVVTDVIMPMINGIELCKLIKADKPDLPVLMLTALGTMEDKLEGFESGADDYLVKPFEFKELLARIRVLLKRGQLPNTQKNVLTYQNLELDLNKKKLKRGHVEHELTAKEFALLAFLMKNKEKVHDRLTIIDQVWDLDFDTGTNIVDVYITLLRKKVDKEFVQKLIHTRVGMGYYFGVQ